MRVKDVMASDVVTVGPDEGIREAARKMVDAGISGLPVVVDGRLVGMITESDFLEREADKGEERYLRLLDAVLGNRVHRPLGDTVAEAMSRDPVTIAPEAALPEAARLMKRRGVKRLPVVDESGRLLGIVSRADVLTAFVRSDDEIDEQIRVDVVGGVLLLDADTLEIEVADGVVRLGGAVPTRTEARLLEELTRRIDGVVRVESDLSFDVDDALPPDYRARTI